LKGIWGCYCCQKQLKLWMHHIPFHAFSGRQISLNACITSRSILSQADTPLWVYASHPLPSFLRQIKLSECMKSHPSLHRQTIALNVSNPQVSLKCIKSPSIFSQAQQNRTLWNASNPSSSFCR
jgi:hypothetical protein